MMTISRKTIYAVTALIALVVAVLVISSDARNAEKNATYIVSHNMSDERIEAELKKLSLIVAGSLNNALRRYGGRITDPDKFSAAASGDAVEQVISLSRSRGVPIYLETFSPRELADIASFYKTPSGQALLTHAPMPVVPDGNLQTRNHDITWLDNLNSDQRADLVAFLETRSGQAMVNAVPILELHAADLLVELNSIAEEKLTSENLAQLVIREDLVEFDDPTGREMLMKDLEELGLLQN